MLYNSWDHVNLPGTSLTEVSFQQLLFNLNTVSATVILYGLRLPIW